MDLEENYMGLALEIVGSFKGTTGHDHLTRSIVRALQQKGIKIHLEDLPTWSPSKLPRPYQDEWFEQLSEPINASERLFFCMPHQVEPRSGQRTINYTMFEADRIPQLWVEHGRSHDLIVVPLESSRKIWVESGVEENKVVVCPLGADSNVFKRNCDSAQSASFLEKLTSPSGRPLADCRIRFLNVSAVSTRKNLLGLLGAWIKATRSSDSAALIVKGSFPSSKARNQFWEAIRELQRTSGKTLLDAAPFFWLDDALAPHEMPNLYHSATHYISVSHGEGFDLPMLEAAFCGLELIAPRHSSYACYLDDEIAHMLPVEEVPVSTADESTLQEFFAGSNWWKPSQEVLCKTIRAIIDRTAQPKKSAYDTLAHLTWEHTAERLIELIFERKFQTR